MNTNLILTLIILAIAVIAGVSALILNRRKRLMTIPKSPPQAAEWWSLLDQQWQAIFKAAIGIKREPTAEELVTILSLTELDCHSKELTSLEPLQALTGLQSLNCGGNPRTSLEPLRACTGLQSLNCSDNQLTSLEPLQALTGLRTLNCSWNQLTDLEPLHGLKSLKQLDCRNNPSLSQSEIEHFHKAVLSRKEVNWLWWSSLNQQWQTIFKEAIGIESEPTAEELVTILSLTKLDCHSKKLTNLEPLRALTGLQSLGCSHNRLTSLKPLQACLGLQTLDCRYNQLTSLEPLQALTGLQTLNCSLNRLTSLEPLRACLDLQTLDCRVNKLTNLEGLQALTGLQSLDCSLNRLTSLEPLYGLKSLKNFECENNPSLSQSELERFLTKNRWWWWSSLDAQWQAILQAAIGIRSEPTADEWVAIILSLTKLDCRGKKLTNLELLGALTGLRTLNCSGTQLTNLEPLHGLKSLERLMCGINLSLSQPEIERFLTNKKRCWWSLLNWQWQAIFKEAIGINSEPTETELETILNLTQLDCSGKGLTSLEPLWALTGLQSLNCGSNHLTSLEPLRALMTGLQTLNCNNSWLTSLEPLRACPGLRALDCSLNQLRSLEGLQACTGLQTLDCGWSQLTSLEPLRACPGLQTLNCSGNQLTNLEPLHGLKSLKRLTCGSNLSLSQPEIERFLTNKKRCWWSLLDQQWQAIFKAAIRIYREPTEDELVTILSLTKLDCSAKMLTSLEPLRALTGLQTLDCQSNKLTSLEPLRALTGLQTLDCQSNKLTSLEPLRACPGLQTLDCSHNQLTSLEPLRACPGLQILDCGQNQLTSLEPLQALTGLQTLKCYSNQLTSLEPLQALTGLQTLGCGGNKLTSLEGLQALTGLQTLNCGYDQLTSLEGLQACTGLQTLYCSQNQLTSLEPLQALTGLQTLGCCWNRLTSLEPLRACPGLQTLNCSQNQLTSLDGLQACPGLQTLNCQQNQLTSLEGLQGCPGLQTLYCNNNQLTSLEPLQALTGLQTLDCQSNQLTSLEPLYGLKSLKKLDCRSNPSLSEPEIERLLTNNKWYWWSSLDWQWQAIFKAAIGIKSEPTEDELVAILSLTQLDCSGKSLTSLKPLRALTGLQSLNCSNNFWGRDRDDFDLSPESLSLESLSDDFDLSPESLSLESLSLEPLRALTGLQTLNCQSNQLTNLEPLHGLKSLKELDCRSNPSLSVQEIERFEKVMPSCRVFSAARDLREAAKLREQLMTAKGIDKIVPANNNFSFRLFDQLLQQSQGQNIFISPLSVALALAMTYNGAAGNTQTVMAKTLGLENLSLEEVNTANLALRSVLLQQPGVSLLIANSLWLRQDFCLEPAFLTPTQLYYAANVTNADFHSPATVSDINQWVKENTQGKIGPVVQHLDPLTVLLLINAIYFKGTWTTQFDKNDTRKREFTLLTGKKKLTPMMYQSSYYHYYQGPNYQAIRLPYKGSSLSMTIFLPDRGIPLEDFPLFDHWQEWQTGGGSREGTIVLPRFQAEYQVTLNEALKALGMAEAFSVKQADFSQMAKVPKSLNIYISEVKHQTFVEVNEEGTVAAAMTYSGMGEGCAPEPEPFEMIIDHPFLFTIQDDSTGTVLFLGAIVEPK